MFHDETSESYFESKQWLDQNRKMQKFISIHSIIGLIFTLFVAVQVNDPDPVLWMTLYGLTAFIALRIHVTKKNSLPLNTAMIVSAFAVGLITFLRGPEHESITKPGEYWSEIGGAIVVMCYLIPISLRSFRQSADSHSLGQNSH